ncbi:MAG: hypothetical protein NWE95_13710 [Candidatus Bathyarchaeota archaeon]|nr:hypothetical protein [Candidatus Bathyarchaeota archaeon]
MTEKYNAWLLLLEQRDQLLVYLAVYALAIVAAWISIDYLPIPESWRVWLKRACLIGGLAMYLFTLYMNHKAMIGAIGL